MFLKTTDYDFGLLYNHILIYNKMFQRQSVSRGDLGFQMSEVQTIRMLFLISEWVHQTILPIFSAANSQYTILIETHQTLQLVDLDFFKRATTTHTELATAPSTAYGVGTQRDFVVLNHRSGTGRSLGTIRR